MLNLSSHSAVVPDSRQFNPSIPMADVIDALKRLERIGSENSKTTQKLIEAAEQLSERIISLCALGKEESISVSRHESIPLPSREGFYVPSQRDIPTYTIKQYSIETEYKEVHQWTRDLALRFSEHIANGLLDLIVSELEKHHANTKTGVPALEAAKDALDRMKTSTA